MDIIGIDPGASGGIAFIDAGGAQCFKMPETERDVYDLIREQLRGSSSNITAYIEAVSAMPGNGVSSMFKFGRGYGFLRGCLIAAAVPFHEVRPQAWQKHMKCLTKGDKNVSKARAQQIFPQLKITHATADALLIARYGWERENQVSAPVA